MATTWLPLGGRTAEEWLPLTLAFWWRRLRRRRFTSDVMAAGARVGRRGLLRRSPVPVAPPQLRDVRLVAADYHGRPLGVLSERSGRRLTAVLACRVVAFSLLDHDAQERRLARWGLVLSGAGGSAIRRLQWIERTAPAQGDELARWVHTERDPAVPLRGTPMIESYLELISSTARVTQEHEILLAVQVDAQRVRGADGATRALVEQTERVAQGLEAAEVTVLGALSPGQLARTLRTAFDPYARAELSALEAADPDRDGLDEVNAWPLGARESWDHYQADGALHATYWIGAWPRVEVSPMFMDSLLGHSGAVRTVAVTFEPLAARSLDPRGRGGDHPRPRRPRAAGALRAVRDGAPAPGGRRHAAARGRARRRPRRGPAERLRHRLRPRSRRSAPRLRRGHRARRPRAPRAAPPLRAAGRRVHVHAAAVPGAAMSLRTAERPGHRCTTRHAQAIYPFVNAGGLGGRGVFIGRDSGGGAFCYDPWVLYGDGALDDPNAIVLGKLGQGKSALVKTLLWRMLLFGRRAFVLDVKREYGPLCEAVGVRPISLVPGGGRAPQPAGVAPRGARPARAAARGDRDGDGRSAHPGRGGRAARGAAGRPRPRRRRADAAPDRRGPVLARSPRWRSGCRRPPARWPPTRAAPRSRSRTSARDRCAGCSTAPRRRGSTSTPGCWCSTCTRSATRRRSGS